MRNKSMTAAVVALTMAGGLTIQAQGSQTRPTPGASQAQPDARQSGSITVTGCLREESPGNTGSATGSGSATAGSGGTTAGMAGRSSQDKSNTAQSFVLTDARVAQGSNTSALGSASRFQIQGVADAELRKHVGHQVEVTGRLVGAMGMEKSGMAAGSTGSTGSGSTATTGSTGAGSTGSTGATGSGSGSATAGQRSGSATGAHDMNELPKIQASNVKMVAATCSAK